MKRKTLGTMKWTPRNPDVPIDPMWAPRVVEVGEDEALLRKQMLTTRYGNAGVAVTWRGEKWIILDAAAEGRGELMYLVSPDFKRLASFVLPSEIRFTYTAR